MKRKKIIKSYFKEMLLFLKIMELNFSKIKKKVLVCIPKHYFICFLIKLAFKSYFKYFI